MIAAPLPAMTEQMLGRFLRKVDFDAAADEGCWRWTGGVQSRGYPSMGLGPRGACRTFSAHRLAHEWWNGPIAEGLTVDHTCHNADRSCPGGPTCRHRRCVNPDHLEAVTSWTNTNRAAQRSWAGFAAEVSS